MLAWLDNKVHDIAKNKLLPPRNEYPAILEKI